jgi:uncharacterized protein
MSRDVTAILAEELSLDPQHVSAVVSLFDEQNTVPFIARYRRDRTGGMDESTIRRLLTRLRQLRGLEQRKSQLLDQVRQAGKLTDALQAGIEAADSYALLHDLGLPYGPTRRTLATIAREKGLEPFAQLILAGDPAAAPVEQKARDYIDATKQVANVDEVLVGVTHILSEHYAQRADGRAAARELFRRTARLRCKRGEAPEQRCRAYREFFDFDEPAADIQAHRLLAINRGERSAAVAVRFDADEQAIHQRLEECLGIQSNPYARIHRDALNDALRRSILPDLEKELRGELTERAERHAVDVLARNLRNFLWTPPLLNRAIMGILPGHRNGCSVAVIDPAGNLVADTVLYPHSPLNKREEAAAALVEMARTCHVELIAIATGTACRETEQFVSDLLTGELKDLRYSVVSSVGVKAYMTSREAVEEFPDRKPEVRAAVTIARRLRDPLEEMVKIDPRFAGIGPYQYDVRPKLLRGALGAVVESVANEVGADLNTASVRRLRYISGLDTATARKIVAKRKDLGRFDTLFQLLQDEVVSAKALYQAAGFLTLTGGSEPLDATHVHIEQYDLGRAVLKEAGYDSSALADDVMCANLRMKLQKADVGPLAEKLNAPRAVVGQIVHALAHAGEDPRKDRPPPILRRKHVQLEDLTAGMKLSGIVRNVVSFGAFVDIGLKEDGLVHVSQLTDQYIRSPQEVLDPGEVVTCWLLDVDTQRRRISLTMLDPKLTEARRREAEAKQRAAAAAKRAERKGPSRKRTDRRPERKEPRGAPRRQDRRQPSRGRGPRGARGGRSRFRPSMGATLGDLLREARSAGTDGGKADSAHTAKRAPKPRAPKPRKPPQTSAAAKAQSETTPAEPAAKPDPKPDTAPPAAPPPPPPADSQTAPPPAAEAPPPTPNATPEAPPPSLSSSD